MSRQQHYESQQREQNPNGISRRNRDEKLMTTPMPPDQMSDEDRVNDIVDSINAEPYLKHGGLMLVAKIHDHIRAIRRKENEACAKVAEAMQVEIDDETKGYWSDEEANGGHSASRTIANRIRARVKE
jgi:hypothetical protein